MTLFDNLIRYVCEFTMNHMTHRLILHLIFKLFGDLQFEPLIQQTSSASSLTVSTKKRNKPLINKQNIWNSNYTLQTSYILLIHKKIVSILLR